MVTLFLTQIQHTPLLPSTAHPPPSALGWFDLGLLGLDAAAAPGLACIPPAPRHTMGTNRKPKYKYQCNSKYKYTKCPCRRPGLHTTTCTQASIQQQKLKYNHKYVDLQTHRMLLREDLVSHHIHTYNLTINPKSKYRYRDIQY